MPIFSTSIFLLSTPHSSKGSNNHSQQANLNVGLSCANFLIVAFLKWSEGMNMS